MHTHAWLLRNEDHSLSTYTRTCTRFIVWRRIFIYTRVHMHTQVWLLRNKDNSLSTYTRTCTRFIVCACAFPLLLFFPLLRVPILYMYTHACIHTRAHILANVYQKPGMGTLLCHSSAWLFTAHTHIHRHLDIFVCTRSLG